MHRCVKSSPHVLCEEGSTRWRIEQVHNLRWSSPQHAENHAQIALQQWDAAATLAFSGDPTQGIGAKYYEQVLAPDELRFLASKPLEHGQQIPPEAITGDVVVFIQEGVALVDHAKWAEKYAEIMG